jgi:hypothetical protein
MKLLFWSDPNDSLQILPATDAAIDAFGHRYGSDFIVLSQEHIDALVGGKVLAWHDSEYSTFVGFREAVLRNMTNSERP